MNVLDENVPAGQRALLQAGRVALRQIGRGIGRKGMKDTEVIALLHGLNRPTFFTLDVDYFKRRLCHEKYCVVHLDVDEEAAAEYARLMLRHREFNSRAKRLGCVIQASPQGITLWRIRQDQKVHVAW